MIRIESRNNPGTQPTQKRCPHKKGPSIGGDLKISTETEGVYGSQDERSRLKCRSERLQNRYGEMKRPQADGIQPRDGIRYQNSETSDHGSIGNGAIFDNHDDAIANVEIVLRAISFFNMILVDDGHVLADSCILIKNGPLDCGAFADTDRRASPFTEHGTLLS